MQKITPEQYNQIQRELEELDLSPNVKDELLDHLCCLVEQGLLSGQSFPVAIQSAFAQFEKDEIQELNKSITSVHQKNLFMKILVISFSALAITLAAYFNFNALLPAAPTPSVSDLVGPPHHFSASPNEEPPSIHPIHQQARMTSGFGMRLHPIHKIKKLHRGMDFAAPQGTPVLATAAGQVIKTKFLKTSYGKHLIIQHDATYSTLYAQLSEILVKEGQLVQQGDTIGLVGSSGASTAPHLHYEVRKSGEFVDPQPYLHP